MNLEMVVFRVKPRTNIIYEQTHNVALAGNAAAIADTLAGVLAANPDWGRIELRRNYQECLAISRQPATMDTGTDAR